MRYDSGLTNPSLDKPPRSRPIVASNPPERRRIVVVLGPTGVGKTAVGIRLAGILGGEIISADSRQIYRGMDVGTAKPTEEELRDARHHLIDIVEPRERYDAARFAADAEGVAADLLSRGAEPIVVGGTGLYLESLFEGLFEGPGRDDEVRSELDERLAHEGSAALHAELAAVDPETASRLHPNDSSRIVRALEVYLSSGETLSAWQSRERRRPAYRPAYYGLTMPRERLYGRIERRVDRMLDRGLLDEIRDLLRSGRLAAGMPGASAVGYRELLPIAAGESGDLAQAVETVKRNTRRYAKRQLTWFSGVPDVSWIDVVETSAEEISREIASAL